jgi:hypothetical protein
VRAQVLLSAAEYRLLVITGPFRDNVVHEEQHRPCPSHKHPHLALFPFRLCHAWQTNGSYAYFLSYCRNILPAATHVRPERAKSAKKSDYHCKMCDLNVSFIGFSLEYGKRKGVDALITHSGFHAVNMLHSSEEPFSSSFSPLVPCLS